MIQITDHPDYNVYVKTIDIARQPDEKMVQIWTEDSINGIKQDKRKACEFVFTRNTVQKLAIALATAFN